MLTQREEQEQRDFRTQLRKMPEQKPGRSKQDYQTPPEFIEAVKRRLDIGWFRHDLAASPTNAQAATFYTEQDDSLKQDWHDMDGWLWLNPPFSDIGPWVEKAAFESAMGAHIAMLIPASVGANWWARYVQYSSYQLFL